MNLVDRFFVLGVSLLAVAAACGCTQSARPSDGVNLKIPWAQDDGSYRLQEVPVYSLKDLSHLQGDAADIRVDADITPTSFSGLLALFQFTQLGGDSGGLITLVPTDTVSLGLAAVYAQTEYIRKFDTSVGAGDLLSYPRKIALMDKAVVSDGQGSIENNAMYLGTSDATVIVHYGLDQLPISVNAGILAHEHFHSLFQSLVLNALGKSGSTSLKVYGNNGAVPEPTANSVSLPTDGPSAPQVPQPPVISPGGLPAGDTTQADASETDLYNTVLIRGINEGFADVWGWLYTGQPAFIYNSLPSVDVNKLVNRSLSADLEPMIDGIDLGNKVRFRLKRFLDPDQKSRVLEELTSVSYWQGAHYARFIYALIKARGGVAPGESFVPAAIRTQAAKSFMSVVTTLRDQLLTNAKTNTKLSVIFPVVQAMKSILPSTTRDASGSGCDLLQKAIPSAGLSDAEKASLKDVCPTLQGQP